MKLYSRLLIMATLPAAFLTVGCDNVKEGPDRYHAVDRIQSDRRVLVMEFTGQSCPNCPKGAQTVSEMHEAYPENLVAVCLHPFNNPQTDPPSAVDPHLRSEEATVMYEFYKPDGFPCAIFDGTTESISVGVWNGLFRQALVKAPQADIETTLKYNEETRKLTVSYSVEYLDNESVQTNILLWLTEDGIVALQKNEGTPPMFPRYENNHVLRASLNGEWGESLGRFHKAGDVVRGSVEFDMPEEWNAEKCNVVSFVMQMDKHSVLQALQTPLYEQEEEKAE